MHSMCADWFESVSEYINIYQNIYAYIYLYIYIYIDICKSCKSDMGKNKSLQSSYIFLLSGATNRYEPIEIKLIIKNTNLRVRVG